MYIRESMLQICSSSVNPQNESPFWKTERKSIFGSVQDVDTVEYGSNKRTGHQPCFVPLLCSFALPCQGFDDLDEECFLQPERVPASHDQQVRHVRGHRA